MTFPPHNIYSNYLTEKGFSGLKDHYLENWDCNLLDKVEEYKRDALLKRSLIHVCTLCISNARNNSFTDSLATIKIPQY